jgi:hypothetical protein
MGMCTLLHTIVFFLIWQQSLGTRKECSGFANIGELAIIALSGFFVQTKACIFFAAEAIV